MKMSLISYINQTTDNIIIEVYGYIDNVYEDNGIYENRYDVNNAVHVDRLRSLR